GREERVLPAEGDGGGAAGDARDAAVAAPAGGSGGGGAVGVATVAGLPSGSPRQQPRDWGVPKAPAAGGFGTCRIPRRHVVPICHYSSLLYPPKCGTAHDRRRPGIISPGLARCLLSWPKPLTMPAARPNDHALPRVAVDPGTCRGKEARMYALVRRLDNRAVAVREAATFATALVIAELFYKFHSFSLECLAFLATWAALSALL